MARAVIYTRVSSDPTKGGRSVSEQEAECRAVCVANGWEVAEVLSDNDVGASRHSRGDRTAYASLANVLQPGDMLVMWESSRAQRNLGDYVGLRDLCAERGVRWCISGTILDPAKGGDRFTSGIYALIDEKAAEETRDRVRRAQKANAEQGKAHGKLPFGYRAERDPDTGKIARRVPDEDQAPIVREMASRILGGEAIYAIAQDFNNRGVPTASPSKGWTTAVISTMIKRPTYAGLRSHLGEITSKGDWEPIISPGDHQALVSLLTNPARISHRGVAPKHLLSGIAVCGVCQSPVRRISGKYPAYCCAKNYCVRRKQTFVDENVELAIVEICKKLVLGSGEDSADVELARAEVRKLNERLAAYKRQAIEGDLDSTDFRDISAGLRAKIAKAERKSNPEHINPHVKELAGPNAARHWGGMTIERRRSVIRSIARVTILPQSGRGLDIQDIRVGPI